MSHSRQLPIPIPTSTAHDPRRPLDDPHISGCSRDRYTFYSDSATDANHHTAPAQSSSAAAAAAAFASVDIPYHHQQHQYAFVEPVRFDMDKYVDYDAFDASAHHMQHRAPDSASPMTPAYSLPSPTPLSHSYTTLHDNASALSAATSVNSPFSPLLDSPDAPPPLSSPSPAPAFYSPDNMPMDLESPQAPGLLFPSYDPYAPFGQGNSSDGTSFQAEMDSVFMPFGGLDLELNMGGNGQALKQSVNMQLQPFPSSMDFQQNEHGVSPTYLQQQQQFTFPQLGSLTPPGVEPRSLTLDPNAAPAVGSSPSPVMPPETPHTPSWATHLWNLPVLPSSASPAVAIPQQHASSPLAPVFQPSSAPPFGGLGLGLGPSTSFDFGNLSANANNVHMHMNNAPGQMTSSVNSVPFAPAGGNGSSRHGGGGHGTVRGSRIGQRVRSISQRAGQGIQHAFRTVTTGSSTVRSIDTSSGAVDLASGPRTFDRSTLRRRVSDAPLPTTGSMAPPAAPQSFPVSSDQLLLPTPLRLHDTEEEDRDATVRRRKKPGSGASPSPRSRPTSLVETDAFTAAGGHSREGSSEKEKEETLASVAPARSELKPPKLAPSTWQLFFTHWIQQHQMQHGDKKLNVAQAAKEAGIVYARMSDKEKEPYKEQSEAAKAQRNREMEAWQRTLTPEDIRRENAFRAAQRKAGKSRRGNIKDPNAPKKPLSAYFMFLRHIRDDAGRVRDVFGDERETTAQSVLAAQKWRSMSDEEKKPFLAQAEREKLAYEAARRLYEEGTVGIESTMSFDLYPGTSGSGADPNETTFVFARPTIAGSDSEPDGEDFLTDDDRERPSCSTFQL